MFTSPIKVVLAFCAAIMFMGFIAACSSAKHGGIQVLTPNGTVVSISEATKAPVQHSTDSWNGLWKSDPALFEATISGNLITINIVDKDSSSLYWKGTWDPKTPMTNGSTCISKADTVALENSLMGSTNPTKEFTYSNHILSYDFTMLGTTKTVHLSKEAS